MSSTDRRRLLKAGGLAALATGLAACNKQETSGAKSVAKPGKRFQWKLVTTWPPNLPVFSEGVQRMADEIRTMSGGRLDIRVFHGGELVPPLETFDAVSQGMAEMGHGAAYYWAGKSVAAQFFTAVPFGMNAQQMYAWLEHGSGLDLWRELYARFNLYPIPAGNSGVQMGGWFNRQINSLADMKGLKMRIPGLGGKVLAEVGASPELLPGGEIYTSLERGVIDATEWVGPYHDYIMGFHKVAKYYYYPGWHEPGSVLELIVNKQAFAQLDDELQAIVEHAALRLNGWMLGAFDAQSRIYLKKLIDEGIDIRPFPDEVIKALKTTARDVVAEVAAGDPFAKRVYESFSTFQKEIAAWSNLSERAFYNQIQIDI